MKDDVKIKFYAVTIDCKEPEELAKFYAKLLHWDYMVFDKDYAMVYVPGSCQGAYPGITIQGNPNYVPPVWPEQPGEQQIMEHLDLAVNDLEAAVEYAKECGATEAKDQFSDSWRVMIDPVGHPFCLCRMKEVMDSPQFGLL